MDTYRLREIAQEILDLCYDEECGGEAEPEPAQPKSVQGRIRGTNTLHLQYGSLHNYKTADVEVTDGLANKVRKAELGPLGLNSSFAGSNTQYVVGTLHSDGSVEIDGIAVDVPKFAQTPQYPETPSSRR